MVGVFERVSSRLSAWRGNREITVAIAGLSRSGKTAFITSAIANLEAVGKNPVAAKWLGGLDVLKTGRLQSTEIPRDRTLRYGRQFPYVEMVRALTGTVPEWPTRTANTYEIAIDLHFWPGRKPDRLDTPTATLRLIFVDYPGEWLVDVPLLEMSFLDWSKASLERLQTSAWSEVGSEFLRFLEATDWSRQPDDNEVARQAALEWQRVLVAAHARGLKWIQPGQFVRKRDQSEDAGAPILDEQALWFSPLPGGAIAAAKKGSIASKMAERYSGYQKQTGRFYSTTLKDATHHVILVDVIEALAEGEDAFQETAEVLAAVYRVFTDRRPLLDRFLGRTGFEKVLLLATKADTVPASSRPALRDLLISMCSGHVGGTKDMRLRPHADYVAAIRATEDIPTRSAEGEPVTAVQGMCADTGTLRRITAIDIPTSMPDTEEFERSKGYRPPRFVPPKIDRGARQGIPNARLGTALDELIGDLLR